MNYLKKKKSIVQGGFLILFICYLSVLLLGLNLKRELCDVGEFPQRPALSFNTSLQSEDALPPLLQKGNLIDLLQFLTDFSNRSFFIFYFQMAHLIIFSLRPHPHFFCLPLCLLFLVLIFLLVLLSLMMSRGCFLHLRTAFSFASLCSCFVQTNLNTLEADMMGCKCCD